MIRIVNVMGVDTAEHVLFQCSFTVEWRLRKEVRALFKGFLKRETDIEDMSRSSSGSFLVMLLTN